MIDLSVTVSTRGVTLCWPEEYVREIGGGDNTLYYAKDFREQMARATADLSDQLVRLYGDITATEGN